MHSPYRKQTSVNRYDIATATGTLTLSVPVQNGHGKVPVGDALISRHSSWQRIHWRTIETAYGSSPFFEFYRDDLYPFYHEEVETLREFNLGIQETILSLLDFDEKKVSLSEAYIAYDRNGYHDFREHLLQGRKALQVGLGLIEPYHQVFVEKQGFIPHLSILDLLFNMGPEARLLFF
ncbi:MAG: WbqC family protein [Prevotellaceae bacterium]|jgi:hypothetical protein|nr:WbqC family protein [Prevotellaceae bacterium]